jgi:hypothetical protein
MVKKVLSFFLSLFALIFFLFPHTLLAAGYSDLSSCPGGMGFQTAIGCIPFATSDGRPNPEGVGGFFLKWGLGIAGGISFILIIYSSVIIITSSGDPHKMQAGKELLTAALSGLVLLIFSMYILRVIGVDLLKIPGF